MHVQRNQPHDIIKYIVNAATTTTAINTRERERATLKMIRLLCTASDRMEVWLSSDDAIRVKRWHDSIRSSTIKTASHFFLFTRLFFLGITDFKSMLKSCHWCLSTCLSWVDYLCYKIPLRDYAEGDVWRMKWIGKIVILWGLKSYTCVCSPLAIEWPLSNHNKM